MFIELGHMGDMLTTASVIKLVRENKPGAYIICLCSPSASVALKNNAIVDEVVVMDTPVWYLTKKKGVGKSIFSSFLQFKDTIRKINADTVINVRATSYHLDHIAVWMSGVKERVGFGNKGLDYLLTYSGNAPEDMSLPIQKLNLVSDWLGLNNNRESVDPVFFSDDKSTFGAAKILRELQLGEGDKIIGINPGAQHNFTWPEQHFIKLCTLLNEQFDIKILFLGTSSHESLVRRIQEELPFKTYSAVGKTSLTELYELLKMLILLITIDTGIRHLANAVKIPVVAIRFGADGYDRYGKYADKETVLINRVPCAPCGLETCPLLEMVCMTRIEPATVCMAVTSVLKDLGIPENKNRSAFE